MVLIRFGLAVLALLFLGSNAVAQTPHARAALELHLGYGGGGSHLDELVGGALSYRFAPNLDGIGLLTAVVARPPGRAVFAAVGLRLIPERGPVRPYLAVGPLVALRSYDEGHLGGFAGLGLEAVIAGPPRNWGLFVEGRTMQGGGSWTQLVGGVRTTILTN